MDIERRLERLEKQNRVWKPIFVITLLFVGAALLALQKTPLAKKAWVHYLHVGRNEGESSVFISDIPHGPNIRLTHPSGKPIVWLSAESRGSTLGFLDERMQSRLALGIDRPSFGYEPARPYIEFNDENGKAILTLPDDLLPLLEERASN